MTVRQRAGLAAATFVAAAVLACGDPNAPVANFPTYADTLELYALNGAPRGAPTAIRIISGISGSAGVAIDASFLFDVAVDLDAQNRPVLYPVRSIAAPFINAHRVGLRRSTQSFDAINQAPDRDYRPDTALVVAPGEVVLIQSADPSACSFIFGGVVYAKMIVDSVRVADRRVFARVTADPNCGFRSLVPGIPED